MLLTEAPPQISPDAVVGDLLRSQPDDHRVNANEIDSASSRDELTATVESLTDESLTQESFTGMAWAIVALMTVAMFVSSFALTWYASGEIGAGIGVGAMAAAWGGPGFGVMAAGAVWSNRQS